jgi:hypothetical protein
MNNNERKEWGQALWATQTRPNAWPTKKQWTPCRSPHCLTKKKKNRRQVVYNSLDFGHYGGWKNRFLVFSTQKCIANHCFTQNTFGILLNQSMGPKSTKNLPKTDNQSEIKNLLELKSVFLSISKKT